MKHFAFVELSRNKSLRLALGSGGTPKHNFKSGYLIERRIIRIAFLAAAIDRFLAQRVQRALSRRTFYQVGVGDEGLAERDEISPV